MTLDWIVGLLLVAVLAVATCSMMGMGLVGMLVGGRIVRCRRCGRPGLSVADRPVHDGGCPHRLQRWAHAGRHLHLHH